MPETIITVHGEHESTHAPERATVTLTVSHEGASRDIVLTHTAQLHTELQSALAPLHDDQNGPVTAFSANSATASSTRPWSQDGTVLPLLHRADASLTVTFSDFGELARWLAEVSAHEGVAVHGVNWALTKTSLAAANKVARDLAVQNAIEKATDYARSLGLDGLQPRALSDVGLSGEGGQPFPIRMSHLASTTSEPAQDGLVEFAPELIVVSAAIEARFSAGHAVG